MEDINKTLHEISNKLNSIFNEMENDLANDNSIGLTEFHFRFNEIQFARDDFQNAIQLIDFLLTFDDDPDET
jgi:hypothetical protein